MRDSTAVAADHISNSSKCKQSRESSRQGRENLRYCWWRASSAFAWNKCYAARITVPIVSFLPKRRRIVRGLI